MLQTISWSIILKISRQNSSVNDVYNLSQQGCYSTLFSCILRCYRNYINQMPKAVDIYVLESKIGSGQFGDVFKGYSKVDGTDVAIKTIRRDKIKGIDSLTKESLHNCCKTRFKFWRAAKITILSDWLISRRQLIIFISSWSFVMKAICWQHLKVGKNFHKKKLSSILYKFYMLFKLLSKVKLCIVISNWQTYSNMMVW